jgi:FkbM family methyltransferase
MIVRLRERLNRSAIARRVYRRVRDEANRFHLVVISTKAVNHPDGRRARLMRTMGIDVVLDVGSNAGQYARRLRHSGYRGKIVSFEPLAEPYAQLSRAARKDNRWTAVQLALGDSTGPLEMNVSANSVSSSALPILPIHRYSSPSSEQVGVETVQVERLDDVWSDFVRPGERVMLKVDTQGFEDRVLRGAAGCLGTISAVEIELSLVPLFAGGADRQSLTDELVAQGFELASLEPGFADAATGRLLQFDGLFARRGVLPASADPREEAGG